MMGQCLGGGEAGQGGDRSHGRPTDSGGGRRSGDEGEGQPAALGLERDGVDGEVEWPHHPVPSPFKNKKTA
jgi:hypothetical protein